MPLDELMNCEEFERRLDEDASGSSAAQQHLEACGSCREAYSQHQRYLTLMAAVQTPVLESARAARMIRSAVKIQQKKSGFKQPFVQGFIAASVLAVAMLFGVNNLQNQDNPVELDSLIAQYDWTQEVTIAITVQQDMTDAQLVLRLPIDTGIEGYEYQSEVVWPIDLKKGRNTIVLPVMVGELAQFDEQLTLPASLIYNNSQKDFELTLQLDGAQKPSHGLLPTAPVFKKLA